MKRPSMVDSEHGERFPETTRVQMYGVVYEVDLMACRELLARRALELLGENPGQGSGLELVAQAAGVSRRVLNRFLTGLPVEIASFAGIITRGLKVDVDHVARRVERSA